MKLSLQQSHKWCSVEPIASPSKAAIRRDILRMDNCQTGFTNLPAPGPPRDQTVFKVAGNDKTILVGIGLFHSHLNRLTYTDQPVRDSAEILFDLHHDRLGVQQFILNADGTTQTLTHLPYPEAHSTTYPLLGIKKFEVHDEEFTSATIKGWNCRWMYVWFDTAEVFRHSEIVGFNVCRYRPEMLEFSGWNRLTGYGGQDPTCFGDLHRDAPEVTVSNVEAEIRDGSLHLSGSCNAKIRSLRWAFIDPWGDGFSFDTPVKQGRWSGETSFPDTHGRFRLWPFAGNKAAAPGEFSFDLAGEKRGFTVSMTYDTPMSVIPNYYTPARLREEMALIRSLGIDRIHWIESWEGKDWPSFWEHERWKVNARKTFQNCGNFMATAAEQAHANGMELYAICKIFDLGFNVWFGDKKTPSHTLDIEGRYVAAHPNLVKHPEWTLQSNPAWRTETTFPIKHLRLYSEEPIPALNTKDIRLRTSKDNRDYRYYSGPMQVRQGVERRPHYRWTPAGRVRETGTVKNWYLEIDGLKLQEMFAAIEINGQEVSLLHRGYLVAEAEDAAGNLAPLTVATKGHRDFTDAGYFFWKEWPGWANYTEPILQQRRWTGHDLGLTFQEAPNLPTMLEPTFEGTRDIWLAWLQSVLERGADGINIRTLCNHNGIPSWLKYAFAAPVLETFQQLYGRPPGTTADDYERVRRIRGDAFTQFLRDAKKLTIAHGAKLVTHLESGVEVPQHLDTRMQLFLDWRTWIEEGIVDEVDLKGWTAHNTWVHSEVLPLARRHDVPVHLISPCLDNGFGMTALWSTPQLLTDAYRAGFSGYNFYETDNLIELSGEGHPMAKGYTEPALLRARQELIAAMNEGN